MLVGEALLGELLPAEATRLHAAVADALTARLDAGDLTASAAEVAAHHAAAGHPADTVRWSLRAASDAERVLAYTDAVGHYRRAIEHWPARGPDGPSEVTRLDVLVQATDTMAWVQNPAQTLEWINQALAEVDAAAHPDIAAHLYLRRAFCHGLSGRFAASFHDIDHASTLVPEDAIELAAEVAGLRAGAELWVGPIDRVRELAQDALALARRTQSQVVVCEALYVLGLFEAGAGGAEQGLRLLEEARAIADRQPTVRTIPAYVNHCEALILAGRHEQAAEVAMADHQRLLRLGFEPRVANVVLGHAADALFKLGRWDEAETTATTTVEDGADVYWPFGTWTLARLAVGRGDFEAAAQRSSWPGYEEFFRTAPGLVRDAAEVRAEAALLQHRPAQAREAVHAALDRVADTVEEVRAGRLLCLGLRAQADLAARARAVGDQAALTEAVARAQQLADRAQAMTRNPLDPTVSPVVTAPAVAAQWTGEWARLHDRPHPAPWHRAAQAWAALPRPYPAAYAQWRQAEAALAVGDREQATTALRAAHAITTRLRARPLAEHIQTLARRARIPLPTDTAAADTPPQARLESSKAAGSA